MVDLCHDTLVLELPASLHCVHFVPDDIPRVPKNMDARACHWCHRVFEDLEWLPLWLQKHEWHGRCKNPVNLDHLLPRSAESRKPLTFTPPVWSGFAVCHNLRRVLRVQNPARFTNRYGVTARFWFQSSRVAGRDGGLTESRRPSLRILLRYRDCLLRYWWYVRT